MTPKKKAKELVDRMYEVRSNAASKITFYFAKQYALIAVDEILREVPTEILDHYKGETNFVDNERYEFWQEVKNEIEKL